MPCSDNEGEKLFPRSHNPFHNVGICSREIIDFRKENPNEDKQLWNIYYVKINDLEKKTIDLLMNAFYTL